MENLKIELEKAKKIYPDAPECIKEILISKFGRNALEPNIMDWVKTFEDAYKLANNATRREFNQQAHSDLLPHMIARLKLILIAKVLCGDWEPDYTDQKQKKWYPWFKYSAGSGFVVSVSSYYVDGTYTSVGSRLCFPTKELSDYFGKQFIELHRENLS